MGQRLSRITKRALRRGQIGQTLVILAFGFIVLLGFVGIVTDVSLMFVRYSSLRRAVDAAAVAAAGQMRRAAATPEELARAGGDEAVARGYAYARNIATVNLAARQFVELYGISPELVLVDTCATTPDDAALECDDVDENGLPQQPRKLVRVTAQVQSPTVFLRLLGWGNVTLEATAISETAVLDVVMIFDVSESMANQTSYDDWPTSVRYVPPLMTYGPPAINVYERGNYIATDVNYTKHWLDALGLTQQQMNANSLYNPMMYTRSGSTIVSVPYNVNAAGQPRVDCRVRFFPWSPKLPGIPNTTFDPMWAEYDKYNSTILGQAVGSFPRNYDGFVPTYNYYGCCNDPDGDFLFDDLLCEPMKQVRDATLSFLDNIDFSRGDRVAFVTFDRSAYVIDPDGDGDETHMMASQTQASDALEYLVGVRAEPTFYADTTGDGYWDSFVSSGQPVNYTGTVGAYNTTALGLLKDYPVKDNCYYQNAALPWPYSLYASAQSSDTVQIGSLPTGKYQDRYPTAFAGRPVVTSPVSYMLPPLNDPIWEGQVPGTAGYNRDNKKANYAYELQAGCRGSNVGAALREANNALVDPNTTRLNGSVWVMVMLGDGAAAGTDAVRIDGASPVFPEPYTAPYIDPALGTNQPPRAGQYGVFGLCPYGQPTDLGPLVDNWSTQFPYCMDEDPASRQYCFKAEDVQANGYMDIGNTANPGCDVDFYDADDFARDWADFIGLIDPFPWDVTAGTLTRENQQLPTIFTIGFGLDFQEGDGSCDDNIGDCLGEELLRYIADVGDNNRIDTDHQQDRRPDHTVDLSIWVEDSWGERGPCEGPVVGYDSILEVPVGAEDAIYNPLPPTENCGNYFNAPNPDELQNVFDTIASRMFTRLTR